MSAAVYGVNIIGERTDILIIGIIPLKRYLSGGSILCSSDIYYLFGDRRKPLYRVDMLDKLSDTALIVKFFGFNIVFITQIGKSYSYARIEERLFTQTLEKYLIIINGSLCEDSAVRFESDGSSRFGSIADDLELFIILSAVMETLEVDMLAVLYGKLEPFGKSVHDRRAHAVQTACDFISAAAEFSACVKNGINHSCRRNFLLGMNTYGNTAPVIGYFNDIAGEYLHFNKSAVSRKCLIYRIIDYLINKMMQSARAGSAYIHTRALAHGFKTFENLYLIFVIILIRAHGGDIFNIIADIGGSNRNIFIF